MKNNKNEIKICVPVIGKTNSEIKELMKKAKESHADIVEWRVDCYENVNKLEDVIELLKEVRNILEDKELIFTYRSIQEGGNRSVDTSEYLLLCKTAILTKLIDYIDVEFLLGDTIVNSIVKHARIGNTKVLMSNHDWNSTPRSEIIENRLKIMLEKGADIAKVVCTPRNEEDVEEMIQAGQNVSKENDNIVLISIGELGKKTIMQPELAGSCMTFALLDEQAEANKIDVETLYNALNK